jgi:ankyrin repeat protein
MAVVMSTGIEAANTKSDSALFLEAVLQGDLEQVKQRLDQGVDVDVRDSQGRTALLLAAHENHIAIAEALIRSGADVNARDDIDDSPYLYAGAEGRLEILRMTVAAGADLNSVNRYGGTALIPAAHHGHVETVKYLLSTEIDIDHVNYLGWTALLEAVILGSGGDAHQSIVEMLLRAGADPLIADDDDVSPLDHARRKGQISVICLIEKYIQ